MDVAEMRRAVPAVSLGLLLGLAVPSAGGSFPEGARPTEAARDIDRLVTAAAPLCETRPAEDCADLGFRFADRDGNGGLSLAELRRVRDALEDWAAWRGAELAREERAGIAFGLALVDAVGLEKLRGSYDQNADGRVDRAELLADVRLDERPLGELLLDPAAVDRAAVARRLGHLAPLLDPAFR
jgi:EF hand